MPDLSHRLARLVDELKRRGVLRVAAVYLVAAWLAIQVSDVTFPRLGLPDRAVTFVIVLLAALFPLVIGLSWAFDVTRAGLRPVRDPEQDAPAGAATVNAGTNAAATVAPARVRARVPVTLAGLMAFPLIAFGLWWVNDARGADLDPQLVAVMPFRVAGASPDLAYMREGLMDLIAARIGSSGGGLQVVAPRTLSRTLREELGSVDADPDREEAMDLAIELGAGRLLQGEVIRSGANVTVTATLYDVAANRVIETRPFPPVSADSLHALVDAIATQLIAAESGVRHDRLAAITTRSVPALRSFIEAEHAFRRGEHARAVRAYDDAVQLDTTFALAALGLLRSYGWAVDVHAETSSEQARRIVRGALGGLGEADRAYFEVIDRRPGEFQRDRLDAARRALERHPDQADLRYIAADRLLHYGSSLGIEDALARARVELERVVELDSTYAEPLIHLYELAIARADTAGMRRYGALLFALDSTGPYATKVRYVRSLGVDGTRGAPPVRLDTLPLAHLSPLSHLGWSLAPPREVPNEFLRRFRAATRPEELRPLSGRLGTVATRGGRPSLLAEIDETVDAGEWADLDGLLRSLYWTRDEADARRDAAHLRRRIVELRSEGAAPGDLLMRECVLGHYAVAAGDAAEARRVVGVLESGDSGALEDWLVGEVDLCVRYLRAGAALHEHASDARRQLEAFDEHMLRGPDTEEFMVPIYQLGSARLWEQLGDREHALEVVRRRLYLPWAQVWANELNGERARLADALGYREEAIAAYRDYLAYMPEPEPPFAERAERARQRMAALVGETRR